MQFDIIKRILLFAVLCVVQALVLNHIHLFGCATPLLYIWFIMLFRRNTQPWIILVSSFLLGLCIDTFSNTPGVAAGSATFLAAMQPYILGLFIQRDSPDDLEPGIKSLGFSSFFLYALICSLVYCLLFFTLETFNFFNWLQWVECVGGSTLITLVLILVIDNLRGRS
ncbi:MAG: rod shape-determining protein MreD [Prevotella sp.]|nr:rod shape-determining protein MreD [Prevotella sp.]